MRKERGLGLAEAMISMAITAVALLLVFNLQRAAVGAKGIADARLLLFADYQTTLTYLVEDLGAGSTDSPDNYTLLDGGLGMQFQRVKGVAPNKEQAVDPVLLPLLYEVIDGKLSRYEFGPNSAWIDPDQAERAKVLSNHVQSCLFRVNSNNDFVVDLVFSKKDPVNGRTIAITRKVVIKPKNNFKTIEQP